MNSKTDNELGSVSIGGEVLARLAGTAAMEVYGVVGMAARNVRDGLVHLLRLESLTKGVKLELRGEGEIVIGLHIIVEYGTNIQAISNTLIENVKYRVEEATGLAVRDVDVFVEGVRIGG